MDKNSLEHKREKEKEIVSQMIALYCRGNKHEKAGQQLCPDCRDLNSYALKRIDKCPKMAEKTFCSKCPISCYNPIYKQRIREVMKYSGPRIIFAHPLLVVRHALPFKSNKNIGGKTK